MWWSKNYGLSLACRHLPFMLQDNLITGSLDSIDVINGAHFMDDNLSTCLQVCMTKVKLKQIGWIVLRERLLGNTENSRLCASFALLWFISHSVTFALDIQTPFDIWQCGFKVLNQTPWREMIPPSKQLLGNANLLSSIITAKSCSITVTSQDGKNKEDFKVFYNSAFTCLKAHYWS